MSDTETTAPKDFIHEIVDEHNRTGRFGGRVLTRFPPEPNGYLHIGHAKAIAIDFGLARDYGGKTNLRFDDTNPVKEETEFVDAIMASIRWLGWDWGDRLFFASDYFEQLYIWAQDLIRKGKAYVCDLSPDEVREYRGTLTEPGKNSPWRDRSVEENLDLFERMKNGEFPEGARTLRAKIDMAHPNFNMRDPVMYRILHAEHHRTGSKWHIYPMYDWAHGQSDSIEGDHALAVRRGLRGSPPAVRVVLPGAGHLHAAAGRVRPLQPHLHDPEQALPAPDGERGHRERLGRSAHAHPRRAEPPRLHARGDPGPDGPDGRVQVQHPGRDRAAGALRA